MNARNVGSKCGHDRRYPDFAPTDVARGEPRDACRLNELTLIFVVGLPYELGILGVKTMTRM